MSLISGNAGFGPLQVTYIDDVVEKEISNIVTRELITMTLPNIITYNNKYFFQFQAPYAGKILRATTVVNVPFQTSNLVVSLQKSDPVVGVTPATFTPITNGSMTITVANSVLGAYSSCTPSGNNTFTENQFISLLITGGAEIGSVPAIGNVSMLVEWTN